MHYELLTYITTLKEQEIKYDKFEFDREGENENEREDLGFLNYLSSFQIFPTIHDSLIILERITNNAKN